MFSYMHVLYAAVTECKVLEAEIDRQRCSVVVQEFRDVQADRVLRQAHAADAEERDMATSDIASVFRLASKHATMKSILGIPPKKRTGNQVAVSGMYTHMYSRY